MFDQLAPSHACYIIITSRAEDKAILRPHLGRLGPRLRPLGAHLSHLGPHLRPLGAQFAVYRLTSSLWYGAGLS